MRFEAAKNIVDRAIREGDLPGVCLEVGDRNGAVWRYVAGSRSLYPRVTALNEHTRFDMASCTKMMLANTFDASLIVDEELAAAKQGLADLLKYSLMVVSSLPVIIMYPIIQKYLIKGVLIGSLKG